MPNWRASQSPGAWWGNGDLPITGSGVENLSIDSSGVHSGGGIITLAGTTKCWVKGVRTMFEADSHIKLWYGNLFNTIRDNYMYGSQCHGGTCSQSYGINTYTGSANLFENNICDSVATCFQMENQQGSVYGYNYAINEINTAGPGWMLGHFSAHAPGNMYVLWEGNEVTSSILDDIHGPADFITEFRNRISGWQPGIPAYYPSIPIENIAWSRYTNAVGNVLGTSGLNTRYTSITGDGSDATETCMHSIFALGWSGYCNNYPEPPSPGNGCSASNTCPWPDPLVATTFLRWGNWDTANGSTQWNPSEVPSALPIYANPVPASQTLPSSFYLAGKPIWWPASIPFPPTGPDVSGGDVLNVGGHAYHIPAETCWKTTTFDPAYVSATPGATASWSSGVATVNVGTIPADLLPAAAFTVTGMNPAGYNCNNCIILSNTATTLSYAVATDPGGNGSGGTVYMANDPIGSGSPALNFNADTCYGSTASAPLPPTVVTPASAAPNPVTGTTTNLSVLGSDVTGESNLTYIWSSLAGVSYSANTSNAAKNTTAAFTQAGSYAFQVVIVDTSSLQVTSSTNVTVNQTLSSITVSPSTVTVQVKGTHGFTAKALDQFNQPMAAQPASFSWSVSGGGVISSTGAFTAGSTAGGPFNITATANGVTSLPAQVTVTAAAPPTVHLTTPSDGTTYTAPATVPLAATVTQGTNPITKVQFFHDGVIITTSTTKPYSFSWTNVGAGTYAISAVVTDSQGLQNASNVATITVNAAGPVITQQPQNQTVSVGQNATFAITATGAGLSYQWQYQSQGAFFPIAGATSPSYTLSNVTLADNGLIYECVVSNSGGSVTSQSATLTVTSGTGGPTTLPAIDPNDLPSYAGIS